MSKVRIIAVIMAVLSIMGCVYTPRLVTVYDDKCKIEVKHMELEATQVGSLGQCSNEGCIGNILGAAVVSAGSVIISGSVVVASNIAYWFEKPSQCK